MRAASCAGKVYTPQQRTVYLLAVQLAEENPAGFDATTLAERLGCSLNDGERWFHWLQDTGDFDTPPEP